jgi:GNAT superfamily N-acetyltransferase
MNISLSERTENNITTIDFIDNSIDKVGQLVFEILDNKAIIYDTYIYPDYRKKGILKTHLHTILSRIKKYGVTHLELSVLNEEAKLAWMHLLGVTETSQNVFTKNL